MQLILLRHGIALAREAPGCPPDAERPLTGKGRRRTRAALLGLKALDVAPDVILSSPLVRAHQTAEIAAEVLGCSDLRITTALRGGSPTSEVFALLRTLRAGCVLAVGHAPHLDILLHEALRAGPEPVERLKKSGAARVAFDGPGPGRGTLRWQMQPRALRALAED